MKFPPDITNTTLCPHNISSHDIRIKGLSDPSFNIIASGHTDKVIRDWDRFLIAQHQIELLRQELLAESCYNISPSFRSLIILAIWPPRDAMSFLMYFRRRFLDRVKIEPWFRSTYRLAETSLKKVIFWNSFYLNKGVLKHFFIKEKTRNL